MVAQDEFVVEIVAVLDECFVVVGSAVIVLRVQFAAGIVESVLFVGNLAVEIDEALVVRSGFQ